jgi:hypothetical protein
MGPSRYSIEIVTVTFPQKYSGRGVKLNTDFSSNAEKSGTIITVLRTP